VGLREKMSVIVSGASPGNRSAASASARRCCSFRPDSTWSICVKIAWPSSAALGNQVSRSSAA
jgi:hypothetical protein